MRPFLFIAFVLMLAPYTAFAASGDIVFVAQVPQAADFATIGSTFANHRGGETHAPRGGDLYIRYANGTLKNLTRSAGYGVDGLQGPGAIAVRDPAVHWSGDKVLFSMVIGGASRQYEYLEFYWQLYEVTGLGQGQTPIVTKVPNQPANFNNVMPVYGTDDRIIFSSDRPRNGAAHLYPQRDEYESTATNSGLWSLNPQTGDLFLMDHAPSGIFHPILDSFGRVVYTRWDHLQRDQQAGGLTDYGAFNYANESATAQRIASQYEFFPEPRSEREREAANLNLHTFNHFFPWQINEDGTEHETLNHVGRQELHSYFDRTFNDDGNLREYYGQLPRNNPNDLQNFFQIREDPLNPGVYYGIDAPEFETHASGQVLKMNGAVGTPADQMFVTYVTARETSRTSNSPGPAHSGLYRNPLPMTTGAVVVSHTSETRGDRNDGTTANPTSRYQYRLKALQPQGGVFVAGAPLTAGISKAITFWNPDVFVTYSGLLWELQPVELVPRSRPGMRQPQLESPEIAVFQEEGVDVGSFKEYLRQNALALIVSRNVTSRDATDVQQPFNLRVLNTGTQKISKPGKVYDVAHFQIFQGDQVRGYDGTGDPSPGRRVLPIPLHTSSWANVPNAGGPQGSVKVAADGSTAALVPARRALTWQLTGAAGEGVVRERYWLTFQPGEIRVCASCHGLNSHDQLNAGVPQNKPEALRQLLAMFRTNPPQPPENPEDPGFNPQPPNPPQPPESTDPSYMLGVVSTKKKSIVPGMLISGWKGALNFVGQNAASASKTVELRMSIEGNACPKPLEYFATNGAGLATRTAKVPSAKRNLSLQFDVLHLGQPAGSGTVLLANGKKKQNMKPLTAKEIKKICKGFEKF